MSRLWKISDPEVVKAIEEKRYDEKGFRRGKKGYAGVVAGHRIVDGEDWFVIDVNAIGGVAAPLANRNPLLRFFDHFRAAG